MVPLSPGALNNVSGFSLRSSFRCLGPPRTQYSADWFFSSQLNLITRMTGKVAKPLLYLETIGTKVLHL